MTTARQRAVHSASAGQLNAYAQSLGFPSASALQTMIQLGAHLQSGGKVTEAWVDRVAKVYPAVPYDTIRDYAERVKSVGDLADVIGVERSAAAEYVTNYVKEQTVAEVSRRIDSHEDKFRKGEMPISNPQAAAAAKAHATARAGGQRKLTLRDVLAAIYEDKALPDVNALPPQEQRNLLANALERSVAMKGERDREYAATRDTDRWAQEKSLRGDLELAFNMETLSSLADEELAAAEFETGQDAPEIQPNGKDYVG